jgi:hypothetical protein
MVGLLLLFLGLSSAGTDTTGPQKTLVLLFHLSDEGPGPASVQVTII